jgi:hypothetical protein
MYRFQATTNILIAGVILGLSFLLAPESTALDRPPLQCKYDLGLGTARYTATRTGSIILITAQGDTGVAHHIFLEPADPAGMPPSFSLWQATPSCAVMLLGRPFAATAWYDAHGASIRMIVVNDKQGRHEVPVE